ncbi:type I secretion system permease/ATPase [Acinetobacter sp. NyZ410]|uniref:type I secretion system permease/ATPase n=1 Tax=Acinetobacter sp. NyZ410 TaxID=2929509 RepID=UPI001FBAE084|nr:type I secretion system permease/ATPase [Acinetobacter sp. NyZ410]UOH17743.1 type I secretion system permease/ATPase [Acinetobacter sp. NyZ410]
MKSIISHIALTTKLLGSPISEAALLARVGRDQDLKIDYGTLTEVLRSYGFDNQLSKRSLQDIPALALPVTILLKNEEAAVITEVTYHADERTYHLLQTDGMTKVITAMQLEQLYLGFCWFIKPKVQSDLRSDLPEYHLPKAWFWKVIWRFRKYYYQVVLATLMINFLALLSSLYVMNVYDRVIPNQAFETLWVLSIGVIIAISFEFISKLIRSYLTDIAGKKADLIISSALFRRVMQLRLVDRPSSAGAYANNLREFEAVREFMTSASLLTIVDLPFLFLFISVIGLVGGKLAFVPLALIPIMIAVGFFVQRPLARYINESMKESSQRQGLAVEAIDGIETLKTNNATNWAQQRWDNFTAKTSVSSIKVRNLSNLVVNFAASMQQLNTVFLVVFGTYLIHSSNPDYKITMGALIASVILSGRALAPLSQIASLAIKFQSAKLALQGINNIVARPIERDPSRQYISLASVEGQIAFEHIQFQYQRDASPAVKDITLNINSGEKVAILGHIGSGKSTLLKLASGLYEANAGHVTLDNIDIRQIDPSDLRSKVSLLSQSPRLFLGTLRDNLELARTDHFSTDQQLMHVLHQFGLDKVINQHPQGLDMQLGENGLGLSGGQKQLIALARLTLRDPQVVLLDEPTTGLDQETELSALDALQNWAKQRTLLVVTHRPQVLALVDRIIVMENGAITMDGPKAEILAKLVQQQPPNIPSVKPKVHRVSVSARIRK